MTPFSYSSETLSTLALVPLIISYFSGGMIMSLMDTVMPPRVAQRKPVSLMASRKTQVFSLPAIRKYRSMVAEMVFLSKLLLMNPSSFGMTWFRMARPTEVSMIVPLMRILTGTWSSTPPASMHATASSTEANSSGRAAARSAAQIAAPTTAAVTAWPPDRPKTEPGSMKSMNWA